MKSYFCILAFAFVSLTATATPGPEQDSPQVRANRLTRQLSEKIGLNEAQYVKIRRLNLQFLVEQEELKERFAADAEQLDQQLLRLQDRYEWDMAAILWPRQLVAYQQSKTNMTALGGETAR